MGPDNDKFKKNPFPYNLCFDYEMIWIKNLNSRHDNGFSRPTNAPTLLDFGIVWIQNDSTTMLNEGYFQEAYKN